MPTALTLSLSFVEESWKVDMSHRNTLNELTEQAATRETWEDAASDVHRALQIVGIVLDELSERIAALEAAHRP